MGADVIHPAPGSEGRPSFTSLVANVDSDTAKYVAATRVQTSRQEMIEDLEEMAFVCSSFTRISCYLVLLTEIGSRICCKNTMDTDVTSKRRQIRHLAESSSTVMVSQRASSRLCSRPRFLVLRVRYFSVSIVKWILNNNRILFSRGMQEARV